MAFNMKTWVDRITEYPTRRRLRKEDGSDELVTVSREEGQVSEEGDAFSAENMNDLESRIDSAFKDVNNSLSDVNSNLSELTNDLHVTTTTGANGDIDLPVVGTGKRVIYAYNNANLFVIPRFIVSRNCWGVKVLNDDWIPVANTEVTIYYAVVEAKS